MPYLLHQAPLEGAPIPIGQLFAGLHLGDGIAGEGLQACDGLGRVLSPPQGAADYHIYLQKCSNIERMCEPCKLSPLQREVGEGVGGGGSPCPSAKCNEINELLHFIHTTLKMSMGNAQGGVGPAHRGLITTMPTCNHQTL